MHINENQFSGRASDERVPRVPDERRTHFRRRHLLAKRELHRRGHPQGHLINRIHAPTDVSIYSFILIVVP